MFLLKFQFLSCIILLGRHIPKQFLTSKSLKNFVFIEVFTRAQVVNMKIVVEPLKKVVKKL